MVWMKGRMTPDMTPAEWTARSNPPLIIQSRWPPLFDAFLWLRVESVYVLLIRALVRSWHRNPHRSIPSAMKTSLVFCLICASHLALAAAAAPQDSSLGDEVGFGDCPLNVTEMKSHPWMIQQCIGQPDAAHCCQAILDLIRILLFSWLNSADSFVLPTPRIASVCLDAFQRHLRAQGIAGEALQECKLGPQNFVSDASTCREIANVAAFERAVNTSGMKQYCNGTTPGIFQCNMCVWAMGLALNHLQNRGGPGGTSNCQLFVMMYAGGGINCYDALGPDAAYCIMSVRNLSAVAASAGSRGKSSSRHLKIALAGVVPAVIVVLLWGIYGLLLSSPKVRSGGPEVSAEKYELFSESSGLVFFGLSEIREATGEFSAANVIGSGGFSTVYKGALRGGSAIAVKRFKDSTKRGDADFRHEVQVISRIKHRNLLPLRGYCVGPPNEQILVYDFMPNGSLADCLFGGKPRLKWDERYRIAVGIARALAYLHQDVKPAIIHRDVKAANVLLDEHLNPLVADFGLAKFKQETDGSHYTTRAVGTLGYVAPEYALYGHLTDKTDVFGFGVVLLELVTGRRALDSSRQAVEHLLVSDWVCDLVHKGRAREVIDPTIRDSAPEGAVERVIRLALQCTHPRALDRPSIAQALFALEAMDRPLPDTPSPPASEWQSEASPGSRADLTWLISPDSRHGRSDNNSSSIVSISTDSSSAGVSH